MKRTLALLLVAAILAVPVLAQTPAKEIKVPWTFRALQVNYTAMSWADYCMTTWALRIGGYGEANPVAKLYVEKPGLAIPILAVTDLVVHWGTDSLYRDGQKKTAWALLIIFNVARGYILYHNIKQAW